MKKTIFILIAAVVVAGCTRTSEPKATDYLAKTVRIAQSEIVHNPELWMADFGKARKWDGTQGRMAKAMLETDLATGDSAYLNYVQALADYFVQLDSSIKTYKLEN